MTLILSADTTPNRSVSANNGRIYDYLYAVDTTQFQSPVHQALGWGLSLIPHHDAVNPEFPEIPSWLAPDYPFVAPSEDIQGYVSDLYLSFDDPLHEFEIPIRISRITKHGENLYSVRFVDANNNVVFDSSAYNYTLNSTEVTGDTYTEKATNKKGDCVYKHYDWGWEQDGRTVYELLYWETELITLKMTVRRSTLNQFTLYPDSAELDVRAMYQYPDRVRSITVENVYRNPIATIYGQTAGIITGGSVQLWERYNMQFNWEDNSDIRTSTIVTVSAIPGSGEGIVPVECDESEQSPPVSSFNNTIATPTGDFFIKGDACHTISGTDRIEIGNSCTPCCECQDMTTVGRLLNELEEDYYCIGGKYKIAVDKYKKEIEDLESKAVSEEDTTPSMEYIVVKGNRLFAKFRFIFRNTLSVCMHNLTVTISTTNMELDSRYVSQSAPTAKDYSECLATDYLASVDVTKNDESYTVRWEEPIITNQQVILKGLYRLNTLESSYSTRVSSITYYDEDNHPVDVDLTFFIQPPDFGYNNHRVDYDDFTNDDTLTTSEFNTLSDDIRKKCMRDKVDEYAIRNTNPSSDIVEEHRDDPTEYVNQYSTKRYLAENS